MSVTFKLCRFERFDKFEVRAIDKVTRHLILVAVEVQVVRLGTCS